MDKAELLDFIRSQRELASNRTAEHGVTQWAVIAGLLYVVLEFVSDASPLSRLQTDWQMIFGYYALAQFALMAAYMVVTPDRRYAANRAFENRVEGSLGSFGVFRFITWMTLIFAAPALGAHVAARHAGSGTLLGVQLAINEWTAWAFFALMLAFAAAESVAFWRTGFPPPPLPRAKTRLQSASVVLLNLLMLELVVGNLFLLVKSGCWSIAGAARGNTCRLRHGALRSRVLTTVEAAVVSSPHGSI